MVSLVVNSLSRWRRTNYTAERCGNLPQGRQDIRPGPTRTSRMQTGPTLRPSEDSPSEPIKPERLKMSDPDEEPDRERVCFVRARAEPEAGTIKSCPIKSEQVKLETVTNHITAASNAKTVAEEKKAYHIKRAITIVEAGNYQVTPSGGLPSRRARILWRISGSMISPEGIKYEPEEDEIDLLFDMPMRVSDYKHEPPDYRDPVQRGHRVEVIHPETKVILREPLGWCAVIRGIMHPLEDFLRGPLRKPRIEVQARAAFKSLFETYQPEFHAETIRSLEWGEHLRLLRTMPDDGASSDH